jgi:hypothetical protein
MARLLDVDLMSVKLDLEKKSDFWILEMTSDLCGRAVYDLKVLP